MYKSAIMMLDPNSHRRTQSLESKLQQKNISRFGL